MAGPAGSACVQRLRVQSVAAFFGATAWVCMSSVCEVAAAACKLLVTASASICSCSIGSQLRRTALCGQRLTLQTWSQHGGATDTATLT